MRDPLVEKALNSLTEAQRSAVSWNDGALLVVAGPGSGKTRVLTSRIARILDDSAADSFRILALTFTRKAADEMTTRVLNVVPGQEKRVFIGTFHSFAMQLLQQHGIHIGVRSDFAIYSADEDRRSIMRDALRLQNAAEEAPRFLAAIDRLKARLLPPEGSSAKFRNATDGARVETAYRAYEDLLTQLNVLDFPSLIQRAYSLTRKFPRIAKQYRHTYRYWMIDEFQDTTDGQYRLIRELAGNEFSNVFIVADDDQLIFEWNGASAKQLQRFRDDFNASEIQLPTNYRCPSSIVTAANRLVTFNRTRDVGKLPLEAGRVSTRFPAEEHIGVERHETDDTEAASIAAQISSLGRESWTSVAVIARTNALLERAKIALDAIGVASQVAQRRDEFRSPHFRWLAAVLNQLTRPLDRRNFERVVAAFNTMYGVELSVDLILGETDVSSRTSLEEWTFSVESVTSDDTALRLAAMTKVALHAPDSFRELVRTALQIFPGTTNSDEMVDLAEDRSAWGHLERSIAQSAGRDCSLSQFLQELAMRSKDPPIGPQTVSLLTIHAAKGKEFDHVFLLGLAEGILPSFQSVKAGSASAAMEEERRNCFVAITRTRERLVLSYAGSYRGWSKAPSRFLREMGCESPAKPGSD